MYIYIYARSGKECERLYIYNTHQHSPPVEAQRESPYSNIRSKGNRKSENYTLRCRMQKSEYPKAVFFPHSLCIPSSLYIDLSSF